MLVRVRSLDEQRKKAGGARFERKPIALEAVLDTKCRKCGGSGEINLRSSLQERRESGWLPILILVG